MKMTLLITTVFLLSACGEKDYTINDFIKNNNLRTKYQQKCKNQNSLNCNNTLSAIDIIQQAEGGITEKQLLLGNVYFSDHNFNEAILWLTKVAADKDNDQADQAINKLSQINSLIRSKKNLTKDDKKILSFLEKKLNTYKKKGCRPKVLLTSFI